MRDLPLVTVEIGKVITTELNAEHYILVWDAYMIKNWCVNGHCVTSPARSKAPTRALYHIKIRASRQFIQVQNLKVITTKINFRKTTQVNSNSA